MDFLLELCGLTLDITGINQIILYPFFGFACVKYNLMYRLIKKGLPTAQIGTKRRTDVEVVGSKKCILPS